MSEDILPIPPIPGGFREAAQRGTLIPFVGAGASRIAGCPSWSEFADGALRYLVEEGKFSHKQLAQIGHLNPRVKLSIALGLEKKHGTRIDFRKLLHPSGKKDSAKGQKLFGSLCRLGKTFVTTNYDEWLDEEIGMPIVAVNATSDIAAPATANPRKVIHKVHDLTLANLNQPNTVIHLHGSLVDPDGMVLTTQHYVRHYANDRLSGNAEKENRVLTFLEHLFQQKTVLFVGYGLEELEILEYVILKARRLPGTESKEAKHYLLQGFYSHEHELMRSLTRYYLEECGIQLISYLRDHKDWDQILDVLEEFARAAPASNPLYVQEFKEMGELLND
jgi:phenylpyruvate tautomerase PptA (4-oxalocrotonate tautomerase family)